MRKLLNNYYVMAFASGILTLISGLTYIHFLPGWICFVPLFITLQNRPSKECFRAGFIFGITIAIPSFYWMIAGAQRFTGSDSLYSYLVFIISSLLWALYFGGINYCFNFLRLKNNRARSSLINAFAVASLYVTGEALLMYASMHLPWFGFHSGNALMDNMYSIQAASVFGIHGMSFILVFVNYLFADFVFRKQWIKLAVPAAVISVYLLLGFYIYQDFNKNMHESSEVKIAILNGNIPPEIKWNDSNGNLLVENLLGLEQSAAKLKPDMALWTESAIPWTYSPNDDLVNEIKKISGPANITNLLGINTDYKEDEVYNSVYALMPDGKVTGRYDKRILLSFIEQPFGGVIFPFLSSQGFFVKAGEDNSPLETKYGKAGIMICNESSVPYAASSMVNNGAQFLLNVSNDGWFNDTYIADQHFYNVRMRAVETRKDIAFNSNQGFSGLIKASGEIIMKERSTEPFVKMVTVQPNNYTSLAATNPMIFIYACALFIAVITVTKFIKKPVRKS